MKGRGPRPKPDADAAFRQRLRDRFRSVYDPERDIDGADITGWWRDEVILAGLGPALAELADEPRPDVVLAPQSRGTLVGALVALHLGVGLIELRKDPGTLADADTWLIAHTPPDYRDRNLEMGIRANLLAPGTRVLFVDDWVDTGGQLQAARAITTKARAHWCGAAVIIDALTNARLRHDLGLRALLNLREL